MTPKIRDNVVPVRLTADERRQLGEKAETAGISISSFVRASALKHKIRAKPAKIDAEAVRQLAAIGNNLNQVARALNLNGAAGRIDEILAANIRRHLEAIQGAFEQVNREVVRDDR